MEVDILGMLSVIVAALSVLVMLLIGWNIFNYLYFDYKVKERIKSVKNQIHEENKVLIASQLSRVYLNNARMQTTPYEYSDNAKSWHFELMARFMILAIDNSQYSDSDTKNDIIECLCEWDAKGYFYKIPFEDHLSSLIESLKSLLSHSDKVYDLLKSIEEAYINRAMKNK